MNNFSTGAVEPKVWNNISTHWRDTHGPCCCNLGGTINHNSICWHITVGCMSIEICSEEVSTCKNYLGCRICYRCHIWEWSIVKLVIVAVCITWTANTCLLWVVFDGLDTKNSICNFLLFSFTEYNSIVLNFDFITDVCTSWVIYQGNSIRCHISCIFASEWTKSLNVWLDDCSSHRAVCYWNIDKFWS